MCDFSHNYSCKLLLISLLPYSSADDLPYSDLSIKELIFFQSSI